jgi:hypothetical protein
MQMMTNQDIRVYQKMSPQQIAQVVRQSGQFPSLISLVSQMVLDQVQFLLSPSPAIALR